MPWVTEDVISGPSANDVLADTGSLGGGSYNLYSLTVSASLAATVEIQHRNAANNANVFSQRYFLSALNPLCLPFSGSPPFTLDTNERIRVVITSALPLGSIQASFFYT